MNFIISFVHYGGQNGAKCNINISSFDKNIFIRCNIFLFTKRIFIWQNIISFVKKCSLKNLGLFNFHSIKKYLYSIKSHGRLSDDRLILLLLLFIVFERKFTSAKQIISSWVKGFSFEDRVFSMCTTVLQTSFGRTFL